MSKESYKVKLMQQRMAIDRTVLANERTFLSYSRSAMALMVAGLSFMHFANDMVLTVIGILFIPVSLFTFFFGLYRFTKVQKRIREERKVLEEAVFNSEM